MEFRRLGDFRLYRDRDQGGVLGAVGGLQLQHILRRALDDLPFREGGAAQFFQPHLIRQLLPKITGGDIRKGELHDGEQGRRANGRFQGQLHGRVSSGS